AWPAGLPPFSVPRPERCQGRSQRATAVPGLALAARGTTVGDGTYRPGGGAFARRAEEVLHVCESKLQGFARKLGLEASRVRPGEAVLPGSVAGLEFQGEELQGRRQLLGPRQPFEEFWMLLEELDGNRFVVHGGLLQVLTSPPSRPGIRGGAA